MIRSELSGAPEASDDVNINNSTGNEILIRALIEWGVRGVRKPQNRAEIRQKTANRIRFYPEYQNRTYMEAL